MQAPHYAPGEHLYAGMDLLRFTTAGSVDDGKSTLIGRLLYDTRATFDDQLDELHRASLQRGDEGLNLALMTDGLRAEREQGITIDVAYRYFATPRRKFIIADTPGHLQYTRNMITGASSADLAVVLIDARQGVLTQSKRHGFIASLLRIPHVVVAVNKMDAVGYAADVFAQVTRDYRAFGEQVGIRDLVFIPVSALHGDNVVRPSAAMPWYDGPTLLDYLETVPVVRKGSGQDFRFPVQYVVRPHQDFRGLAGRVASGAVRPGDAVVALPSGVRSRVASVEAFEGPRAEALAGESVVITLADDVDVSRGDMLVREDAAPPVVRAFQTMLCWMGERPLQPERPYVLAQGTARVSALVTRIAYRLDIDTLAHEPAEALGLNDVGLATVHTARPIPVDAYAEYPGTGSFILIDPDTNDTVAAGMIVAAVHPRQEGADHAAPVAHIRVHAGAVSIVRAGPERPPEADQELTVTADNLEAAGLMLHTLLARWAAEASA